jgi:dihydrofolate reductase
MSKVIASASMSLDGYISGPGESGFEHLFAWYGNGDVAVPTAQADRTFHMTAENARLWREFTASTGALVVGRRLFDLTNGWDGNHPAGAPVVVLTHKPPTDWPHPDAPFTFVTDGIKSAIATAKQLAGEKAVGITAGTITGQAIDAGLVDEIWVMLAPVVLGGGTPFFAQMERAPVTFRGPDVVAAGGVTHLRYTIDR